MGQDSSTPIDEHVPPQTLKARTLDALASHIKNGKVRKVVVMTGAGISTSAGIPDFRSPETGLYANLVRLNLPYAEAVFDISYFRQNPEPFYALAHELYPGKFHPTISHAFIRLLHDKGMLLKLFTQNIDCLEREAGVPGSKIVEAHGSFADQRCIECETPYPEDLMQKAIKQQDVPHCMEAQCNGLVKPDIVFFGESLPAEFFNNRSLPSEADLCIVIGTSLTVQPFASLPQLSGEGVPRLLINKECVGGLGSRRDDVLLLGDCDDGVRKLAAALGWLDELEALWKKIASGAQPDVEENKVPHTKDETLEAEIDELTAAVDHSLKLSSRHVEWVKNQLSEPKGPYVNSTAKGDEKSKNSETNSSAFPHDWASMEQDCFPDPASSIRAGSSATDGPNSQPSKTTHNKESAEDKFPEVGSAVAKITDEKADGLSCTKEREREGSWRSWPSL